MRLLIHVLNRNPSVPNLIHLEDVESSLKEVLFKGDVFSSHKLHREQLVVPTVSKALTHEVLFICLSVYMLGTWGVVRDEALRLCLCLHIY